MLDVTAPLYPSRNTAGIMWDVVLTAAIQAVRGYDGCAVGSVAPTYLRNVGNHSPNDTVISQTWMFRELRPFCSVSLAAEMRVVTSVRATAKCTGTGMRLRTQCGIDSSTAVEFNTTIMPILLMGCCDFISAGAVAVGGRTGKRARRTNGDVH
jgi:hypothetical protein